MEPLKMSATFDGLEELPRRLRTMAAVGAAPIRVTMSTETALQLARRIENRPQILRYGVERTRDRLDVFFWALLVAVCTLDVIEGPAGILASYLRGLLQ